MGLPSSLLVRLSHSIEKRRFFKLVKNNGSWHELSWQSARNIVAIGAKNRGSCHETQVAHDDA